MFDGVGGDRGKDKNAIKAADVGRESHVIPSESHVLNVALARL
jgi:hypothetical protein